MSDVYEFKEVAAYGSPPVNNPEWPTVSELLKSAARDGWEFAGLIPGETHPIAEHRRPTVVLLKRVIAGTAA